MKKSIYLLLLCLPLRQLGYSQGSSDTSALVKEFIKVMSFANQPYVHYTTVSKLDVEPLVNSDDTLSTNDVFYKNKERLYCHAARNEMYVEDSLLVEINNEKKTIWISKANTSRFGMMNSFPESMKKLVAGFEKNYIISKIRKENGLARLTFETRKLPTNTSELTTKIVLEFWEKTKLPLSLSIAISNKWPLNDELITALKTEGLDASKLLQRIDGVDYIVTRNQTSLVFTTISTSESSVTEIPSYKQKVVYDQATGGFAGIGDFNLYQITTTF